MNVFERRDGIRAAFGRNLLSGQGLEIGAGAFPQELPPGASARYYDLRNQEEGEALFGQEVVAAKPVSAAALDFPEGADFLIAHNVLEHCPNPLGVLIEWNRLVRAGGVVIISLPHFRYCHDARRLVPPIGHLVDDFLDGANGKDFTSLEHTTGFVLGWAEDFCRTTQISDALDLARRVMDDLHYSEHDAHWHAFDTDLSLAVVGLAAALDGLQIANLRCWSPEADESMGDILISYQIVGRGEPAAEVKELVRLHGLQKAAAARLADQAVSQTAAARSQGRVASILTKPFEREGVHGFVTGLPKEFLRRLSDGMKLTVREDDRDLGPGDSLHEDIRHQGGGRFSFWETNIYLSSSDGSDCNTNGRRYVVVASPAEPDEG